MVGMAQGIQGSQGCRASGVQPRSSDAGEGSQEVTKKAEDKAILLLDAYEIASIERFNSLKIERGRITVDNKASLRYVEARQSLITALTGAEDD